MYEIFSKLLTQHNVKASDVSKATGINQTVFSEWKKGKSNPKIDKLQKIAEYFGVSVDYLTSGKEYNEIKLTEKDERDIAKKLNDTLMQLESCDGLMFDGEPLDEQSKELLKVSLESAIRTAKITAKKKFTPNKYK